MIDFGNFYQLIAKNHLSHWLETLPAQIAAWQRESLHGQFKQWKNAVEFLPEMTPYKLDLLHSVTAESEQPLSEGQMLRLENLMRNLMPWRKGRFLSTACRSIPNGVQTGSGSACCRTSLI